jgi:hypothetical protein
VSNLAKYQGNFINLIESEFKFTANYQKTFSNIGNIDVSVGCTIGFIPSHTTGVIVEIDTDSPDDFKVFADGDTLVIEQKSISGNNTIINGQVIQGNNISMINNQIFVDGMPYHQTLENAKSPYNHRIKVLIPSGMSLDANMKGIGLLVSSVLFTKAKVKISGSATAGLASKSLTLKLSGTGENYCVVNGGELKASISGMGKITAKGKFAEVDADVSGKGHIFTSGECLGEYSASVSGMGSISHSGNISGRIRKSLRGMGSIHI